MAIETDAQINTRLEEIRDETAPDANTKTRIYQALKNIYDTLSSQIIPYNPILAFEYGDEPTIDLLTQQEFNDYMMVKIGGTSPTAPAPVSGASATPDSDTEITLTWTNPA